ncbi:MULTISPECIES: permease-like cell division protein FtsX [Spiribacter]|uniref:permease-like cell division protein FtsX n=1 Tax=Spiribacter TaxID=1335745 RepID=UPI001F2E578A|nr:MULTISPECIES: permease-like cell division protein FtsX [Spiribacter]
MPGRWAKLHAHAAISSLGRLRRQWLGSVMTAAAIGIALALPAAFVVAMDNLESAMDGWQGAPRASVFLDTETAADQYAAIATRIDGLDGIRGVRLITPDEALTEYRQSSGVSDPLAMLDANPLPAVVVAELAARLGPESVDRLVDRLRALPAVADLRVDRDWMARLAAIIDLGNRITALVALLLGLTVILVLFNTLRLDIENHRREIEITRLIGGTNAFIRRPFLYTGVWYGMAGGLIAGLLLAIAVTSVADPVQRLASLYGSGFRPSGPGLTGTLTLVGAGALLGLSGAWLAVGRHLSAIEPP